MPPKFLQLFLLIFLTNYRASIGKSVLEDSETYDVPDVIEIRPLQWSESFAKLSHSNSEEEDARRGDKREIEDLTKREEEADKFEGDIEMDDHIRKLIDGVVSDSLVGRKWPENTLWYILDRNRNPLSDKAITVIRMAMAHISQRTCVRFREGQAPAGYVHIFSGKGCYSNVGHRGGRQKLSIGPGCEKMGIAAHELLHALGFWHEQSRKDRDDWVTIIWENIRKGKEHNFKKHLNAVTLGAPYDYNSLMHYSKFSFSSNRKPTIQPRKKWAAIGQRSGLSPIDAWQVNMRYECPGTNPVPPKNIPNIPVRLVGGKTAREGRVEVFWQNKWGQVCDDNFDINDANVVCRQLGFENGAEEAFCCSRPGPLYLAIAVVAPRSVSLTSLTITAKSYPFSNISNKNTAKSPTTSPFSQEPRFGSGPPVVWMDEVQCSGDEKSLGQCQHLPMGSHNCVLKGEHAGVRCKPSAKVVSVRLVGGMYQNMGRVEVFHKNTWGTVCDDLWDNKAGDVVCRMLGYKRAEKSPGRAVFGKGTGKIWLDDVKCQGQEKELKECKHAGWGKTDCSHKEDASVICEPHEPARVRLIGGSGKHEGRVEVLYNGEWGTICDDQWDLNDANVVCRMIGYPSAREALLKAKFGQGKGKILLDDVQCAGQEKNIADCEHRPWGHNNCAHNEDASVVCSKTAAHKEGDIRLAGDGASSSQGRVEIYHKGVWGTVCDDHWGPADAQVVCRQIGYERTPFKAIKYAKFGAGKGRIWLDDVECKGSEKRLADCKSKGWGAHNCRHSEDAGVICNPGGTEN